jgi:hypothetical protein
MDMQYPTLIFAADKTKNAMKVVALRKRLNTLPWLLGLLAGFATEKLARN